MKEIKGYACDFCRYKKFTKQTIKKHEKICYNNPENKTCGSCTYNDFGDCNLNLKKQGELPKLNCIKWIEFEEL
jgi:hypothetical protein